MRTNASRAVGGGTQTRQAQNAADVADPAPREPNESSHGAKTIRSRAGLPELRLPAFRSPQASGPNADARGRRRARTFLPEIKTFTKIRDTIQPPASGATAPSVQGAQTPKSGPSTSISGPVAAKGRTA
ncbi:hypothetical protein BLTE_00310 [Blastochloris tepida]|uniref:Uncharacterized protein n=1 Tax=Blastochloris tepida TaxID=2233851 RepID=A0A348FVL3_9HYPH|nr:hypothetical protein BLTE_00310 [Blastochloris tepida]